MRVAIFEVCRRPEIPKANTEAVVLSRCFERSGVAYDLHSNDGIWQNHASAVACVDRAHIRRALRDPAVTAVHFATHGNDAGLVLHWDGPLNERVASDTLTGSEIRTTDGFRGRLVVSGACGSAHLASDFLAAGATAFVAPDVAIPWKNLGLLFESFYTSLRDGMNAEDALTSAVSGRDELASYRVYTNPMTG